MVTGQQKIILREMRAAGVRDLLVYCADYKCSHGIRMSGDRWPDYIRLSEFGCPILSRCLSVRRAAKGAPISGRTSIGIRSQRLARPPKGDPGWLGY
jgi:hypothetical protein